jgi:hypothetical protein
MFKTIRSKERSQTAVVKDSCQINGDNMNNIEHEASRHFRSKKREYLKGRINELATNSKNKNIRDLCRGINEFQKGYQLRCNLINDENGHLLADFHSIFDKQKNYYFQLLNVHRVCDVRQIVIRVCSSALSST